jgi:ABC-type multidrug transport system ATPase subunit
VEAAEAFGLTAQLDLNVEHLSPTEVHRAQLLLATLERNTEQALVLAMDLASKDLDSSLLADFWKLIRETAKGRALVITTQSVDDLALVNDVFLVNEEGRLEALGPATDIDRTFGTTVRLEASGLERDEVRGILEKAGCADGVLDVEEDAFLFSHKREAVVELLKAMAARGNTGFSLRATRLFDRLLDLRLQEQ